MRRVVKQRRLLVVAVFTHVVTMIRSKQNDRVIGQAGLVERR